MEFREFLTNETTKALARAIAHRSEQSLQEIAVFRTTFEQALQLLESSLTSANEHSAGETSELVERLAAAVAAQNRAAREQVRTEAQTKIDELSARAADLKAKVGAEREKAAAAVADLETARGATAQSEAALQEARSALEASEAARQATEGDLRRALTTLRADQEARQAIEQELEEARTALLTGQEARQLVEDELQQARATIRADREARQALDDELQKVRAELRADQEARQAAERDLQQARETLNTDRAGRHTLEKELEQARAMLKHLRDESARLSDQVKAVEREHASMAATLQEAQAKSENAEAARATLAKESQAVAPRIQALERSAREAEDARRQLTVKLEATVKKEALLRDRLTSSDAETKRARAEAEAMAQAAAHAQRALEAANARIEELSRQRPAPAIETATVTVGLDFDRLLPIYEDLESGKSVTAVLTALTRGLGEQFRRVALFNVNGNALQGVYQLGFDIEKDITKIVIPLTLDSILAQAVGSTSIVTAASPDPSNSGHLPFGGATGWCLALPVGVKGETVAVIYADEGDQPSTDSVVHASKVTYADLLWRHAVAVLTKLTIDLKALTELGDYAGLLLDEVEYIYGSDVNSGMENFELVERLTENLRCAHETYIRRLESASVGQVGTNLFEDRLNTLIDTRGTTSFGRHLAVAAAAMSKHPESGQSAAAQAS